MQFSIIIPCYNCCKYINNLYESIKKSLIKPNEIIFVDDKSMDGTLNILENFKKKDKIVKIIKNDKNLGPGGARNQGVKIAKFENLIFFDSDVVIKKNTIKNLLQNLKNNDAVVGMYSSNSVSKGLFQELKAKYYYKMLYKDGANYPYSIFSAACSAIKKKVFEDVKGYDQWFGDNNIDYENEDMGLRIKKKYKIILCPKAQVEHDFPDTKKIIKTLFLRSSHWVEFFYYIKKSFDEAGGTKLRGLKCYFSLTNLLCIFFLFHPKLIIITIIITLINFFINYEFLNIFYKKKYLRNFIGIIIFESVIASGSIFGLLKIIFRKSKFIKKNEY